MKSRDLEKRYTQGLINSAKDEREFLVLCRQLHSFNDLLSTQKELKKALASPFIPSAKKNEIAREILTRASFEDKALRFLLLLIENDRIALLPGILEFLPVLWNEEKGISTFEVSSVLPLTEDQKRKLEEKLHRLEDRPVSLTYRIDPSLIGGLSIRKGNIVFDVSISGSLEKLREIISGE
jgi:F-type H+-transporting ATPase subunit delta